jgi:hypothetical protein
MKFIINCLLVFGKFIPFFKQRLKFKFAFRPNKMHTSVYAAAAAALSFIIESRFRHSFKLTDTFEFE